MQIDQKVMFHWAIAGRQNGKSCLSAAQKKEVEAELLNLNIKGAARVLTKNLIENCLIDLFEGVFVTTLDQSLSKQIPKPDQSAIHREFVKHQKKEQEYFKAWQDAEHDRQAFRDLLFGSFSVQGVGLERGNDRPSMGDTYRWGRISIKDPRNRPYDGP